MKKQNYLNKSKKQKFDKVVAITLSAISMAGVVAGGAYYAVDAIKDRDAKIAVQGETITQLTDENNQLKVDKETITQALEKTKAELATKQSDIIDLGEQKQILLATVTELDKQINATTDTTTIENLEERKSAILNQVSTINAQVENLQNQVATLNTRVSELETQLANDTFNVQYFNTSYRLKSGYDNVVTYSYDFEDNNPEIGMNAIEVSNLQKFVDGLKSITCTSVYTLQNDNYGFNNKYSASPVEYNSENVENFSNKINFIFYDINGEIINLSDIHSASIGTYLNVEIVKENETVTQINLIFTTNYDPFVNSAVEFNGRYYFNNEFGCGAQLNFDTMMCYGFDATETEFPFTINQETQTITVTMNYGDEIGDRPVEFSYQYDETADTITMTAQGYGTTILTKVA